MRIVEPGAFQRAEGMTLMTDKMKKFITLVTILCFFAVLFSACSSGKNSGKKVLPPPEIDYTSMFGVDKNINIDTIDNYLGRDDVAYIDLRMLFDPANFAEIGGEAELTRTIKGFRIIPYPYIATLPELPVPNAYDGPCLYALTWNEDGSIATATQNYAESDMILSDLFPKDKAIFLMCGGGGYSSMMKALLLHLGWDKTRLYIVGANWNYTGSQALELAVSADDTKDGVSLASWRADYIHIDFSRLHSITVENAVNTPPAPSALPYPGSKPPEIETSQSVPPAVTQTDGPHKEPPSPAESTRPQESTPPAGNTSTQTPAPAESSSPTPSVPSPTPSSAPSSTPSSVPSSVPPANDPVILTINGSGVKKETTWTLSQLQALRDGYREYTYSTTNNWPNFGYMTAQGISLPYLLRQAGMLDSAAGVKLISVDGYYATVTYNQVFNSRYSYSNHSAGGSSGAAAVEPVIAWAWGEGGKPRPENIRPVFGQTGPMDVNTSVFVKDLCRIEVSTASFGAWVSPGASITDGSVVPAGTEFKLLYGNMDSVRIYYTVDGSEPDYNSPVYNPSASYFQPQLTVPLIIEQSVTIKAFAAAFGKERSPVATFNITVEQKGA